MKIDVFAHILTEKYLLNYVKKNGKILDNVEVKNKAVTDINVRSRLMDRYPDVLQVLTMANPPLDINVSPADAAELARIGNDELAEMVDKYPDKFLGAVACLPWNNIEAALEEIDRVILQYRFKGIQVCTRVNGEPLGLPKFRPIFEKMASYDLPIWIHPTPNDSLEHDGGVFSWPFETTMAMYSLVTSGIFNDYPNLKFITHHCGAMVPSFSKRIKWIMGAIPRKNEPVHNPEDHFRKFYVDTALYGNTDGLICGYAFYGVDHLLFATDAPLGPRYGLTAETISSIEGMPIPEADKKKIFTQNAVNLLRMAI
jgi:predicted TIM-barrel fold metal-dependent hydrolase